MTSDTHPYKIDFAIEVDDAPLCDAQIIEAVSGILAEADYKSAQISVAVVDDPTMHELNRRYLNHDYPTDVLSFTLADEDSHLEGQLIVSVDTAAKEAAEYDWTTENELLLYVVHGTLHLVGYDDATPELRGEMREAERRVLSRFGLTPPYDDGQGDIVPESGECGQDVQQQETT